MTSVGGIAAGARSRGSWSRRVHIRHCLVDRFSGIDAATLVRELASNIDDPQWLGDLQRSYLRSFAKHHPEYDVESCTW